MRPSSVELILDFAIANEEKAADFYRYLADTARQEQVKEVLRGFAEEEERHKARLLDIKAGNQELAADEKIADLGLAEQLDDVVLDLSGAMDYREAMTIAIKAEQAAHELYTKLAEATDKPAWKSMLLGLAQEEAKHKLWFETEFARHT